MGSLSRNAPAGAQLISGVDGVGVGVGGVGLGVGRGLGLGLGLGQQQWALQQQQQQQQKVQEETSKAGNTVGDVHMALPSGEHSTHLKRTRSMAGFEIGGPPPPTWNPGGVGGRPWAM